MESNETLARAQCLSLWLARIFAFASFAAPVSVLVLGVAFVNFYDIAFANLQEIRGAGADMPPYLNVMSRWLLVATAGLYGAPLVVAAVYLQRLFASFAANIIFTSENVTRLRLIGRWLLVAALATNLSRYLYLEIMRDPREGFHLTILPVLYAAMIYVIAYVLEEANRLADDNAKYV